ncbi:uncharacterized protein LOC106178739 isoform X1 [Lingula anatina]|uniref:Uncharacterized protein LOC106178739 isoform X1 n=1 Tax=Lingula anatina TaxID=7574 RepID=A0A1S3K4Q1_LINAN|nr:uncharacterized protein LOC106178739 isoform X1 [Lingula anatina]|eukprot:XP_013417497.1 uncharacterized protein LOC106178739 isoform X1 [Lingula anatina]
MDPRGTPPNNGDAALNQDEHGSLEAPVHDPRETPPKNGDAALNQDEHGRLEAPVHDPRETPNNEDAAAEEKDKLKSLWPFWKRSKPDPRETPNNEDAAAEEEGKLKSLWLFGKRSKPGSESSVCINGHTHKSAAEALECDKRSSSKCNSGHIHATGKEAYECDKDLGHFSISNGKNQLQFNVYAYEKAPETRKEVRDCLMGQKSPFVIPLEKE